MTQIYLLNEHSFNDSVWLKQARVGTRYQQHSLWIYSWSEELSAWKSGTLWILLPRASISYTSAESMQRQLTEEIWEEWPLGRKYHHLAARSTKWNQWWMTRRKFFKFVKNWTAWLFWQISWHEATTSNYFSKQPWRARILVLYMYARLGDCPTWESIN